LARSTSLAFTALSDSAFFLTKLAKWIRASFFEAVEALANAYRLLGDKPEVMLLYADALANANDKNLIGKPSELIAKVLTLEPENMEALWLGGMAKAQSGEDQAAYDTWKKLIGLLPPGSEGQKQIQGLLDQLVAEKPNIIVDNKSSKPAAANGVEVKVTVDIAAELKANSKPNDTVFIYAQAMSGPKMPLAIARKIVSELPVSVILNDSMAIMPNMKLSNFPKVKLLARVSASGNAMPQAGDLIGSLDSVELTDKTAHKIIINDAIK
jgi:cytochrome c-type biogenesis protein CcmH